MTGQVVQSITWQEGMIAYATENSGDTVDLVSFPSPRLGTILQTWDYVRNPGLLERNVPRA